MLQIDQALLPADFAATLERFWGLSGAKILSIEKNTANLQGSPVLTVSGKYTAQGWTEWTQGFQYGSAILQYDATDDEGFLHIGRDTTRDLMASHITHMGVHDHGFNNVSTYGNLWRLMNEGRITESAWERAFYELALKCSGAVQARRWSPTACGDGFIHSFNGPHSLFADTMRTLRALALSWQLGHVLMGEHDERIDLLERLITHARTTARYTVYYGDGRDAYDTWGRVAHESLFNPTDGQYRCASTQQGYSPFSTWTRGLAWVMLGYPEQLEFLDTVTDDALAPFGGREEIVAMMTRAARAACDFYLENTPTDGVPYWDTGAPGLAHLGGWRDRPADPFNDHEPIDSSAAAIAAQGLMRFGRWLGQHDEDGSNYLQAGLTIMRALLDEPYLASDPDHQGLLLHAVYHRPNGWDNVPADALVPCGESCMWGDYHMREAALYLQRLASDGPYLAFFGPERP
ncbi:MAG: glycoside hydrolase family 88 protein [Planctomycetes bacterium]|nr:glycoside hydrolase family 88 protein [Planctomycetota bacterium]